jgi:hypothetical protein
MIIKEKVLESLYLTMAHTTSENGLKISLMEEENTSSLIIVNMQDNSQKGENRAKENSSQQRKI